MDIRAKSFLVDTFTYFSQLFRKFVKNTFIGTRAEWDALTSAEKAQYEIVNLTDDVAGGETIVTDAVTDGDLNPVTSNAVANKTTLKLVSITAVTGASATVTTAETSFEVGQFVRVSISSGVILSGFWGSSSTLAALGVSNIQVAGSVGNSSRAVIALGVIRESNSALYLDIFG